MRKAATLGMTGSILFVALAGLALGGCGEKMSGTYLREGDNTNSNNIDFGAGETVNLYFSCFHGEPARGTYKMDGNKVTITLPPDAAKPELQALSQMLTPFVFVVDDKGCLVHTGGGGKYCKK